MNGDLENSNASISNTEAHGNVCDSARLFFGRVRSSCLRLFSNQSKPSSNPRHWPNSAKEDLMERQQRNITIGSDQNFLFCNNFVKTSKYEPWNFLGLFLLEEFNPRTKVANCYFLLISAMQCVPQISNTNGIPTTLLPLLLVVVVDALFQILEDITRHRADATANASKATRFDKQQDRFVECKWADIVVGDFIKIHSREMVPADVIILSVSEKSDPPNGICYVETKSLDGETNLKIRNALPLTLAKVKDFSLSGLKGTIVMEHPNKLIDSFNGVVDLTGLGREPVQPNNLLLRGCFLRNTEWIIGLVVNTGHDTKIMMSMAKTIPKTSDLESKTSKEIGRIVILLALVCFTGATGAAIWNSLNDVSDIWYLQFKPIPVLQWFIDFFYFFLLHATFIPVSLYVSMTIVRYFQSYLMNNDLEMYYERLDLPAQVRTMTLNEELGQVSHIFSDKTGTLTCNIMDFRKASVNGVSYGQGITEIGKAAWKLQNKRISNAVLEGEAKAQANSVPHVTFYDPKYDRDMQAKGVQKEKLQSFFRSLAICHDVVAEHSGDQLRLSASNPDDDALVSAAAYFGYQFCDRREKQCMVFIKEKNVLETIEILRTIPFTSSRKRMSVIIRDSDGLLKIITKGADAIMEHRLKSGQDALVKATNKHMRDYSIEGLRCLLVGSCVLEQQEYHSWTNAYQRASTDIRELEKRKNGENNKIDELEDFIEQNYLLLGCTAIEDRLQDGVPECIAQLAKAGINIWVLTGDKEETAINIAVACNLLLPKEYMDHIIVNNTFAPNDEAMKDLFANEIKRYDVESSAEGDVAILKPKALIIDGPALIRVMADSSDDGLRDQLLELSQRCKAVVACRVSPDQKREMVNLIKTGIPGVRTLAVGDGANDVAMIQAAHIGVGIKGEEGLQAVNASDYAIAQFRYLSELMLKHGRYNYIGMSNLVNYMFYKNVVMSVAQFWFNFSCAFSGQKYYTEGTIQLFNAAYTLVPILLTASYDMDISPETIRQFPQTYMACINQEFFTTKIFWSWIFAGFLESTVLSVLPLYTLTGLSRDGNLTSFWEAGATCFTAVVLVVTMKLFFMQSRWYWFNWLFIFLSLGVYFASVFLITNVLVLDFNWYQIWMRLVHTGKFWLTVLLLVTIVVAKDIYVKGLERNFNFRPEHILQEMESQDKQRWILSTGKGSSVVGSEESVLKYEMAPGNI